MTKKCIFFSIPKCSILLQNIQSSGQVSIGTLPAEAGACPLLDGVFVSVMRRIFNPGFHKVHSSQSCHVMSCFIMSQDLVSDVEVMLTTTLLPDQCTLMMEETLPRGAYADPDQVCSLQ